MKNDRSPESVERLFDAIRRVHAAWPTLRVGQIVARATQEIRGDCDPFYAENDDLTAAIERGPGGAQALTPLPPTPAPPPRDILHADGRRCRACAGKPQPCAPRDVSRKAGP